MLGQLMHDTVDANPRKTLGGQIVEECRVFPLAPFNYRGEHHELRIGFTVENAINNLLWGLSRNFLPTLGTVGYADASKQQSEVVRDFRNRANRGTGISRGSLLVD